MHTFLNIPEALLQSVFGHTSSPRAAQTWKDSNDEATASSRLFSKAAAPAFYQALLSAA